MHFSFRFISVLLAFPVILSSCQKAEAPSEVLKKSMLHNLEQLSETHIDLEAKGEAKELGMIFDYTIEESVKMDFRDWESLQFQAAADVEMNASFEEENMKVKEVFEFQLIDNELYATLKDLEIKLPEFEVNEEEMQAVMVLLEPYFDETVFVNLELFKPVWEELKPMLEQELEKEGFSLEELIEFLKEVNLKKMTAETEPSLLVKDYGVEKIKTRSGKRVKAYHYEIDINPEAIEEIAKIFVKKMDELLPEKNIPKKFEENWPGVEEDVKTIIGMINAATKIEVWIGKKDYFTYQIQLSANKEGVGKLLEDDSLQKIIPLSQEEVDYFNEQVEFEMNYNIQSEPIKPFNLKKPEDVIDLGPMIQMGVNALIEEFKADFDSSSMDLNLAPITEENPGEKINKI